MEKSDWAAAQKTFEDLALVPNLSPDQRLESSLRAAQVLVRATKFAEAEKRIEELSRNVASDQPQAFRIQIALAECRAAAGKPEQAVQILQGLIDKVADPEIKARVYNALGDCLRVAGKSKDALWNYLWVDVVYHQNRQEHAKALYYLAKLFEALKDENRAKQYREKLEKDKQFAGLEYQKMILGEK